MEKNLGQIINEKYEDRDWERDSKQSNIEMELWCMGSTQETYQNDSEEKKAKF